MGALDVTSLSSTRMTTPSPTNDFSRIDEPYSRAFTCPKYRVTGGCAPSVTITSLSLRPTVVPIWTIVRLFVCKSTRCICEYCTVSIQLPHFSFDQATCPPQSNYNRKHLYCDSGGFSCRMT